MSYFLQPKRVKYRITLAIVGSLLEVTTSPTSPELTIDGMERLLEQSFSIHKRVNGKKYNPKINFIRYADDWVITGDTKELLETQVKPL
ncbi:hypothetical protein [Candidatus Tisiphia endosymbiont of Sialis lutaria]|uniref:hypothetical protein n=1 Tax=Candidatus Tisiphia endosymbiont of Sialis lutaria TaxID=2029164 RepID=UPI00312C8E00